MAEDFGVQGRGAFYDEAGAIRDVVQNHLLQVALQRGDGAAAADRGRRDAPRREGEGAEGHPAASTPRTSCAASSAATARSRGSPPGSTTETFVALQLHVNSWRWQGVPFYIRAGKCLPVTRTEVVAKLRRPPSIVERIQLPPNHVRFRLSPDFEISLGASIKAPGEALAASRSSSSDPCAGRGDLDAYEELLGDAMRATPSASRARTTWRRRGGSSTRDPGRAHLSTSTSPGPGGRRRRRSWSPAAGSWRSPEAWRPR